MNRADVDRIVSEAHEAGVRADLRDANLGGANLWGADLGGANLGGANLGGANLWGANLGDANLWDANLRDANLWGANLWDANLRDANLRDANLRGANLWDANLRDANLRDANLGGANLWGADLRGANLSDATGAQGVALGVSGLLSGDSTLYPTRDGWLLAVGCWQGTPDALRTMIATDYGWPEATGHECARLRPSLLALLALCDDHIARHPDVVADLAKRWPADGAES